MERTITGFRLDQSADWVAELSCGHNQHVRHQPPFQLRPWVLNAESRTALVGASLDCPLCDRAEIPDGLRFVRTSRQWDQRTMPSGLSRAHRIATGRWGRIVVAEGRLRFTASTTPPLDVIVGPGSAQPIPPDVDHEVEPIGPVRFSIDFFEVDREELRAQETVPGEGADPPCWPHLIADGGAIFSGGAAFTAQEEEGDC